MVAKASSQPAITEPTEAEAEGVTALVRTIERSAVEETAVVVDDDLTADAGVPSPVPWARWT